MDNIKLTEKDKKELILYLEEYSAQISEADIKEIDTKMKKKLWSLRKKKKTLPGYVRKMIKQIMEMLCLLNSPSISQKKTHLVIAALHYFTWAEDKIPDYIPVVGYLDDAFIIDVVYRKVQKDILDAKKE